jgi:3-oxoacyl-[acyl-carrier protein] reductase
VATTEVGLRKSDELAGQVAIVTGAAMNIGRAIARSLAAGGAAVMVNAVTSVDAGHETVEMIRDDGGQAELHIADITDPDAVDAMVAATVARFGGLNILVNNHTYRHTMPVDQLSLDEWRKMIDICLTGVFITTHAVIPHMIEAGGGSIINLSGQSAYVGYRGGASRSAAKSGAEGFSRAAAVDLAQYGITVNSVVPGAIDTVRDERQKHGVALERSTTSGGYGIEIPAGRAGLPEEIAAMVRMLAGPDARYVTGQSIHVNGGAIRR